MNRKQRRMEMKQMSRSERERLEIAIDTKPLDRMNPMERAAYDAKQSILEAVERHGITVEELDRNYDRGWHDGFLKGMETMQKSATCAAILVLKDGFRFGGERLERFLTAYIDKLAFAMSDEELAEEAVRKTGIEIDFGNLYSSERLVFKG